MQLWAVFACKTNKKYVLWIFREKYQFGTVFPVNVTSNHNFILFATRTLVFAMLSLLSPELINMIIQKSEMRSSLIIRYSRDLTLTKPVAYN